MDKEELSVVKRGIFIIIIGFITVAALVFAAVCLHAKFSVWIAGKEGEAEYSKAESTRKIKVLEAQAKLESARLLAQTEVERAKGVAESNRIVGDSLSYNENYLKYLWIQAMEHTAGQVIYVPTEAGLPILEAGKRR